MKSERPAADDVERSLLLRVLSTMVREDVLGLRARGTVVHRPDGRWLRLASGSSAVLLPVRDDGFQSEFAARAPVLRLEPSGRELRTGREILDMLSSLAAPGDRAEFTALSAEYEHALESLRLRGGARGEVMSRLVAGHGADCAFWEGPRASLAFDTLAAHLGHPLYPTCAARVGLRAEDLYGYAPEFAPSFSLRWLALPIEALAIGDGSSVHEWLDGNWPRPSDLGLARLDPSHVALPVHPLTAAAALREALHEAGLDGRAVLADGRCLEVAPTLSMRTVALNAHPGTHLKLPLAASTLGRLNRRTIKPGSLVDGAATQLLLQTIVSREPRFQGLILHADETRYAHGGHELLAFLMRRQPSGLERCTILPLAALLAPAPDDRLVIDHLADRWFAGEPFALLESVLTLLLDWQTMLLGYGIALESHQQNIMLVLDDADGWAAGHPRIRLLFKDDDGPRIHLARLRAALGPGAPGREDFADHRIFVDDDGPLLDLFTTITLHLCAGAFAYGLAEHGRVSKGSLLDLVRDRLEIAARRLGERPGEPGAVLRARTLEAAHLPVKAMVTAGTLLTKERSGARDVNKHYTTGPNYLLRESP